MFVRVNAILLTFVFLFGLARPTRADETPQFCAAIQGNGQAIFGHFHSLARLISYFGMVKAAAGSSSGSLTMFLLESMMKNPEILDCRECTREEKQHRISLMLKSLVGFFENSQARLETDALVKYLGEFKTLQKRWRGNDEGPVKTAGLRLEDIDRHEFDRLKQDLGELYNWRFASIFLQPGLSRTARSALFEDYKEALGKSFVVDDQRVFLRPFPVTFSGVATVFGWIGNFYAGGPRYHNRAHWKKWFQSCGDLESLKDKTWGEIAYGKSYTPDNIDGFVKGERTPTACEKGFETLIGDYHAHNNFVKPDPNDPDRIDEPVGKYLAAMPITGLFVDGGAKKIETAKSEYWAGKVPELNVDYATEFQLGYFGSNPMLTKVERAVNKLRREEGDRLDINLSKFRALRNYTWRMVIETSPAEPTIAEAKEVAPGIISNGGWVGGFPATVLKLAGCERVAFIASERKGKNFKLVADLIRLSGGADYEEKILSTKEVPNWGNSSLMRGLNDADAVWCTKWDFVADYLSLTGVYQMSEDTFKVGLDTKDPFFLHRAPFAKPTDIPKYGCNLL
jgi:hypothetical protein